MKFTANSKRWWTRAVAHHEYSLQGRWLPLLGLGGLLTALILPAWHISSKEEKTHGAVSMAVGAGEDADFHQLPAVRIRLCADAAGKLASMAFNDRAVSGVDELREQIRAFRGPTAASATIEAELDCDGRLRYQYTQQVIAAISACPAADGRTMLPLVDRVKFSPRRE